MSENIETLGDALPKEMARVRELMPMYREIGPAGSFALAMMEASLQAAERASCAGDVVGMLRALSDLRGYEA